MKEKKKMKEIKRTYFDLTEVLGVLAFEELFNSLRIGIVQSEIVNEMASYVYTTNQYKQSELDELFCKYIFPVYYDCAIGYVDGEYTTQDRNNVCKEFIVKFIYICNKTYNRYKPILDYYTSNKTNLLNKIENVSERQFDDTPQTSGGVYDDTYSSTYEKTKTQTDLTTLMSRLDEINEKFENIYKRWANEFKGVFIYV